MAAVEAMAISAVEAMAISVVEAILVVVAQVAAMAISVVEAIRLLVGPHMLRQVRLRLTAKAVVALLGVSFRRWVLEFRGPVHRHRPRLGVLHM